MSKIRKNAWQTVMPDVTERLCNAFKSVSFLAYFVVGILLIGGIGVWLPYAVDKSSKISFLESQNVFTYSVAILGTLCVEGFLGNGKKKSLAAFGLIVGVFAFFSSSVGYYNTQSGSSLWVNIGAVLALLIFLIANANDDRFDEDHDVKADATGFSEVSVDNIKDGSK